jgi:hypothetical protein
MLLRVIRIGGESDAQGHFAKSQNLAFLVLICKKCKILRFHDLCNMRQARDR